MGRSSSAPAAPDPCRATSPTSPTKPSSRSPPAPRSPRSPSSTTASAESRTGSRCGSCATGRSRRTRCRKLSSPSGATPSVHAGAREGATWILTLVHRRAVDIVRREERRRAEPLDERREPTGERDRRERVAAASSASACRTALKQLPDPQREALELAYYGGFTQSELAERLGQPARYHQEQDVHRPRAAPRAAGQSPRRSAWNHDAARPDRRVRARRPRRGRGARYEDHLARASTAARSSRSFSDAAGALAYAVDSPGRRRSCGPASSRRRRGAPERRAAPALERRGDRRLAAVAAVVAVGFGIWAFDLSRSLDHERSARQRLERVLSATAAVERVTGQLPGPLLVAPSGNATLIVSAAAGSAEGTNLRGVGDQGQQARSRGHLPRRREHGHHPAPQCPARVRSSP